MTELNILDHCVDVATPVFRKQEDASLINLSIDCTILVAFIAI